MKFYSLYKESARTQKHVIRKERRGWRWWYASVSESLVTRGVLFGLILVLGVGYIFVMSTVSTKGYELKEAEHSVSQLREEIQRLSITIAQYRSLQSIQTRVADLGMVPIDTISYHPLGSGSSVAHR